MTNKRELDSNWRNNANVRIRSDLNSLEQRELKSVTRREDFNAKIIAKMLLDRRLIICNFADKLLSAEIMSEFLPQDYLPTRTNILQDSNDLFAIDLPYEFFLKVNHTSGGLIGVSTRADKSNFIPEDVSQPNWNRYLIHPEKFDKGLAIKQLSSWLKTKYCQEPESVREWSYDLIEPRMYVEKIYRDVNPIPRQLNIYCFHGKAMAFYYSDRRSDMKSFTWYIFLENESNFARICSKLSKEEWQIIIRASEGVSQYTDMVRVDWLLTSEGAIFSELTNYPHAGRLKFNSTSTRTPKEVDNALSSYWGDIGPY
jgi:hypothetical protein